MHLDVIDLRAFYYRSQLGRAAQKVIRRELRKLWPDAEARTVVGYGFAVPLLRPYLGEARRVIALMPGPQGVLPWPAAGPNVSLLCDETLWPLETGSVDRLVVMHGIETSLHPDAVIDECWRVLGPGGRAVFVVPNRAGLWSRRDVTPFGHGRPYSASQFSALLQAHAFRIEAAFSTLFQPPSASPVWRRAADVMERAGRHIPVFKAGGVLMVEVCKQVAPPIHSGSLVSRVPQRLRGLEGIGVSEPARGGAMRDKGSS